MAAITLMCTTHTESGACTVIALLDILRKLDPEVIFLEMRARDLNEHWMHFLEGRAARQYARIRGSEEVAVDDFEMPPSLRSDMDSIFAYVERKSDDFIDVEQERDMTTSLGFEKMNSDEFESLSDRYDRTIESTVKNSGDEELISQHTAWTSLLRQREDSMLSNIYTFCQRRPHLRGVFLVGSQHMSSLAIKIADRVAQEPEVVQWDAWNRPGRLSG